MSSQADASCPGTSQDLARLLLSRGRSPSSSCVTFEDETWSWTEMAEVVEAMAGGLATAGARPGSIVASCSQNRAELVALMLAVWSTGSALAPINPLLTPDERRALVTQLRPMAIVTEVSVAWPGDGPVAAVPLAGAGELEVLSPAPGLRPQDASPGTALILHTSGTTARPKAIELSASNLIGAIESVLRLVRKGASPKAAQGRGAPNLVAFPLSHLGGMFNALLALYNDRQLLLMRRFEVERFVELVQRYRVPSVILNPTMVYMLCESVPPPREGLTSLRFVRSGSAALSPTLAQRFHERYGVPILNCYGQTETAGEVIGWTVPDLPWATDKLGSVGRPHPGVSIRFVDEALDDVAPGAVGELCVRASFVMTNYLGGETPPGVLDDGHLRTGDLGYVDAEGFVWLVGRRKEIVNCGGFKVLPEEVEEALRSHPAVQDVMVAGVADERLGEVPCAFVVLRPTASRRPASGDLTAELVAHARLTLAAYKVPRAVHFLAELPRNATGKLLRAEAQSLVGESRTVPAH